MGEFQSNLEKARSYLQAAQLRVNTMAEYDGLVKVYMEASNTQFVLAYRFMEQHVNKFIQRLTEGK